MQRIRIPFTDSFRACALFHVSRQQRPVFIAFLLGDEIKRLASVGHPVPGNGFRIVDDHGNDVPTGVTGEVLFKSDSMMEGYWNNHAATLESLDDGWYRTGDLAYRDHEGFVFLVDRKKDMIISGGENIYPAEIENLLIESPDIAEASVIGRPDPRWGEIVVAVVVPKDNRQLSSEQVLKMLEGRIARFKHPREVVLVKALPKTALGKVRKEDVRHMLAR